MKLFKLFHQQRSLKFSQHVTSVDGVVVARENQHLNDSLLEQITKINAKNGKAEISISGSFINNHFSILLDKEKYNFITDDEINKEQMLSVLGSIRINSILLRELQWMMNYDYFYHHSLAVACIVARMSLDFWGDRQKAINGAAAALTHDIGITRIPSEIINKVSPLSDEEMNIIREHPVYSYILLSYYWNDSNNEKGQVAFRHHEDPLESGYPRGVEEKNILVQMIKMADLFDALITTRPFRPAFSLSRALAVFDEDVESGKIERELQIMLRSYLLPYI